MSKEGKTGVTQNTPKNILFGAGTIHKNLKHEGGKWNFAESLYGATAGGSKLTITPEVTPLELDGALVAVKGLNVKTGEVATMEVNFAELNKEVLATAAMAAENADGNVEGYTLYESKASIEEGDYWDNIAFVGELLDKRKVIVIMDNALATNGLDLSTANKENSVATVTFACHATLESDLETLPWHIYFPDEA